MKSLAILLIIFLSTSLKADKYTFQSVSNFNGIWEGVVFEEQGFDWKGNSLHDVENIPIEGIIRLEVSEEKIEVHIGRNIDELVLLNSSRIKFESDKSNFVISIFRSKKDRPWVESWSLNGTKISDSRMLITYYRVVNNIGSDLETEADTKFSVSGHGLLTKQSSR